MGVILKLSIYDQRLPSASDAQSTCAAKAGRFNSDLHFPSLSRGLGSKTWKASIINFERSFDLVFLCLFPPAGTKTLILAARLLPGWRSRKLSISRVILWKG